MTVWKDRLALSSMVGFNRFTFRRARRVFKRFHKRASAYIAKYVDKGYDDLEAHGALRGDYENEAWIWNEDDFGFVSAPSVLRSVNACRFRVTCPECQMCWDMRLRA